MNGEIISIATLEKINQLKKENKILRVKQERIKTLLPALYNKNKIDMEVWNLIEKILK